MRPPEEKGASLGANGVPSKAIAAMRYALRGVGFMFAERNVWILLAATLAVCGAGLWFRLAALEWGLVVLAVALVWVAEGLNTALERLTDLASPEFHPLAGKAKDIAAGAVLLAVAGAVSIGLFVFGPRLF
jgi:diacylglycerol kinase (ATP)